MVGFNVKNYNFGECVYNVLFKLLFNWLKVIGVLWYSKLLRKFYLSLELIKIEDMIVLVD